METKRTSESTMLGKLLPELSMGLSLVLLAVAPGALLSSDPTVVVLLLAVEGASLMFFATMVDIASRVSKRPPWWLVLLIVAGVLLMYPPVISVLAMAFELGLWVFLPIAWSLLQRVRGLWTLPDASKEEKIRIRTLTFDRLWIGFTIGVIAAVVAFGIALSSDDGLAGIATPLSALAVGVPFYAIAAFNAWRVHQRKFTQRPTSIAPWLDRGDGSDLSPL